MVYYNAKEEGKLLFMEKLILIVTYLPTFLLCLGWWRSKVKGRIWESKEESHALNSNVITPGTKFVDVLSIAFQ